MQRQTFSFLYIALVFITTPLIQINAESMLNWFWGKNEEDAKIVNFNGAPLVSIPYEMLTEDEKFLKEAAKLVTDIQISSPLEVCQHKVILKIKTSCSSMSEEQLAKLSVNLLNCQSASEGRKTFTCTDDMSLKECTTYMDADTWNAYHLMSNRARAVCYATRSQQFRALTELTINKLMNSAHSQIQTLSSLKENQDRLEEQTITSHKIIESNIQDLTNEKALIKAGHRQLANMTEDIKRKLEKATQDILEQSSQRNENHKEVLADLENIKSQAQILWEKIESSTNRIIQQNYEASAQYEETLKKLENISQSIVFIWNLTNSMRSEVDEKLGWITEYIGTTKENLDKIYRVILHIIYLLLAMIVAAFLQAPFLTRSAILGIVPVNLAAYLKHGLNACLDFVSISILILLITIMHYVMNGIQYLIQSKNKNVKNDEDGQFMNENFEVADISAEQIQKKSIIFQTYENLISLWKYLNRQIQQSLGNVRTIYMTLKSWIWQKYVPIEELSCSYLPARKYHEYVISNREFPSISEDSNDFSDNSPDCDRFILSDDNSRTGAVLSRKLSESLHLRRRPNLDTRDSEKFSVNDNSMDSNPNHEIYEKKKEPTSPWRVMFKKYYENMISSQETGSTESITPKSRALCNGQTRSGKPCRLLASRGLRFCHRHTSGSSEMGD